jgi:hypothetical protein
MEVCSRRRGLVTLGRIISSPESLAYWSGPDNINQLVKITLLVPPTMKVSRETRSRESGEKRGGFQAAADRTASHGFLQT